MLNIFLVETNKKCKSDEMYINAYLKSNYNIAGIANRFIYMNGKSKFKNKESEIDNLIKKYKGDYKVYICFDVDNPIKPEDVNNNKKINNEIIKYCKEKNYEYIWFYIDIENVFIGKKVEDSDKKTEAEKYWRTNSVTQIKHKNLSNTEIKFINRTSNLKTILDKYYVPLAHK